MREGLPHSMIPGKVDKIVQVPDLTDLDGRVPFSGDALDGRPICAAFVHGNGLKRTILSDP